MPALDLLKELKAALIKEVEPEIKKMVDEQFSLKVATATLGVSEAANLLGVTEETVYCMVREKRLPHFYMGSISSRKPKIKFRLAALEQWMIDEEKRNMEI
ncbi:helix-turn-helix domain-containing protein [Paenibacillus rhizolycopersici]|uniref:helix-turn-helix domain-containing protein n=1 Tax=Paenibacillus rhizolycopersici TaxID=2780073 RepID=UPI003D2E3BB4